MVHIVLPVAAVSAYVDVVVVPVDIAAPISA
jgi:hypothetical protein